MIVRMYRFSFEHPTHGFFRSVSRVDEEDLAGAATMALDRAALQGLPECLAHRDNMTVERRRLLRWEVVPRAEWDPGFKDDES